MRFPRSIHAAIAIASLVISVVGAPLDNRQAANESPANALDGGCFKLRFSNTRFVEKSGARFLTRGTDVTAEPIAFEATQLGRFRLYDSSGEIIQLSPFLSVRAGSSYTSSADWTVTQGSARYRIRSTTSGQYIGDVRGTLAVANASFTLVSTTGCYQPYEIGTNIVSSGTAATVNDDGTINGFIDAHAHPLSSAAFGGKLICGQPFAAGGPSVALAACPSHAIGAGALFEAIIGGTDPLGGDDGWPTFTDWPSPTSLLHQQAYYKGIERAWQSGMRIINALLVANRVICELYPDRVTSCDEMEQIRAQARVLIEMQDYIDAQNGGPGQGWFRVAKTPEQVRAIAAQGKLAVVIGVENSELFGCREIEGVAQCSETAIDAGLDELQSIGVSGVYPVHKFDNAFGGTRFDAGTTGAAINVGNLISTGHWWQATSCEGPSDNEQPITNTAIAELLKNVTGLPSGTLVPVYPEGKICNVRTLAPLGESLINKLMDRGMVIHIDHMGVKSAMAALDITERVNYTGVAAVHGWSDQSINGRIARAGGFVTGYAFAAPEFITTWQQNREAAGSGSLTSYGYGSDVNGLGNQPGARLDAASKPLLYPFTAPNGAVFEKHVFAERTWDLNVDGVAQYGMFADWVADVLQYARSDRPELEREFMTGAETYVRMWERARAWQR